MQKAPQENGHIGLEHPERWPVDAVDFLSATTSLTSVQELSKVSGACIIFTRGLTLAASTAFRRLRAGQAQMDLRSDPRRSDSTLQVLCVTLLRAIVVHLKIVFWNTFYAQYSILVC